MKQPIVILHGWNLSAKFFIKLKEILRDKGYQVFVPDFPGFGDEPLPKKTYNTDDYVKFLEKYLNKIKINKCIIIGHSFGGRIGIKFAAENPEKVKKLILTGVPGVRPTFRMKVLIFRFLAKVGKIIFSFPLLINLIPKARKILYRIVQESDYLKTQGVMRETFKNIIAEDLTPTMSKITCPTKLIWGEKDMITPIWIAKKMVDLISNSVLAIVPNEGHSFIYKNPTIFIEELTKNDAL